MKKVNLAYLDAEKKAQIIYQISIFPFREASASCHAIKITIYLSKLEQWHPYFTIMIWVQNYIQIPYGAYLQNWTLKTNTTSLYAQGPITLKNGWVSKYNGAKFKSPSF